MCRPTRARYLRRCCSPSGGAPGAGAACPSGQAAPAGASTTPGAVGSSKVKQAKEANGQQLLPGDATASTERRPWHAARSGWLHRQLLPAPTAAAVVCSLTLMMRNTLRAAVTDACTFFSWPGCPADRNRHRYCGRQQETGSRKQAGQVALLTLAPGHSCSCPQTNCGTSPAPGLSACPCHHSWLQSP